MRPALAADEDGVLADYVVFKEWKVCKLPGYLDWVPASIIPCAGTTAWVSGRVFSYRVHHFLYMP